MPNYYLSVLYKHIIQVENKNVGLKVGGGHKHTIAPPVKKVGGAHAPLDPPLPTPVTIYNSVGSYHFYLGNTYTLTCVVINCMINMGMTNRGGGGGIPVPMPVMGVRHNNLLSMCTLNTLT